MDCFDKQRIFITKNYNHAQGFAFYVLPENLKFQICIFVRVVNHFSPVENIKYILKIYISLRHANFSAMPTESHNTDFYNSADLRFNLLNI